MCSSLPDRLASLTPPWLAHGPTTPYPCTPHPAPLLAPACSEACKLSVLEGLPHLQEVSAAGYGNYSTEGLPASVRRLDLQVGAKEAMGGA